MIGRPKSRLRKEPFNFSAFGAYCCAVAVHGFLTSTAAAIPPTQPMRTESAVSTPPASSPVRALLDGGEFQKAIELCATGSASSEERLLTAIHVEAWTPASDVTPPAHPEQASDYWYARGIVSARAAWPGGRPEQVADARFAVQQLESLAGPTAQGRRADVRRTSVLAAIAAAQEERDELTLLLTHATFLDDQLRGSGVADDPLLAVDELTGDLWLQVDRYEDAMRAYGQAILRRPDRMRAWVGLARSARSAGDLDEARVAARTVLDAWKHADESPVLGQLRDLARP